MRQTNHVLRSPLSGARLEESVSSEPPPPSARVSSLVRNSGTAIAGGLISQGLKALVMISLARSFGATQFGAFSFANAVNAFLFIIAQFGLDRKSTRLNSSH